MVFDVLIWNFSGVEDEGLMTSELLRLVTDEMLIRPSCSLSRFILVSVVWKSSSPFGVT